MMLTRFTGPGERREIGPGARKALPAHSGAWLGQSGFTLLEVMVTVVVVAILAAIAVPSYSEYVTRSKISEATSALSDMRVRMEQYFADYRQYPTACTAAAAGAPPAGKVYLPSGTSYFAYTCTLTASTYTVTATGNSSGGMSGFGYTVDESNNHRTTGLPSGWSGAGASSTCWVLRKNGSC